MRTIKHFDILTAGEAQKLSKALNRKDVPTLSVHEGEKDIVYAVNFKTVLKKPKKDWM